MSPSLQSTMRLGEAFVDALSGRDFSRLREIFHPQIRFRALVPPGLRSAEEWAAAVEHLVQWFGEADRFEITASSVDHIGPRVRVSYRIRLREAGSRNMVEQQAYIESREDRIGSMDLLCSGFVRESD